MAGNSHIPRVPRQCGPGNVARRPLEIDVVHAFDDHHRKTEARDFKASKNTVLFKCGHGRDGIHLRRLV